MDLSLYEEDMTINIDYDYSKFLRFFLKVIFSCADDDDEDVVDFEDEDSSDKITVFFLSLEKKVPDL